MADRALDTPAPDGDPGLGSPPAPARSELTAARAEVSRLRRRLEVRDQALRDLGRRLADLEATHAPQGLDQEVIDDYERRIGTVTEDRAVLAAQLEDRTHDLSRLSARATAQLEQRDSQLARLLSQLQDCQRELAELREREQSQREGALRQIEELRAQVSALESLRILRYTAPVRSRIYQVRRRLRGG